MTPEDLGAHIAEQAAALGFHRVGIVPIETPRRPASYDAYGAYEAWLGRDYHGEMAYMARADHRRGRRDPRALLDGAKTLVAVALAHHPGPRELVPIEAVRGRLRGEIARYARGDDYHRVMKAKLRALAERVAEACGEPVAARACVDTAPLLERDAADRAGLGFTAKNTMLIAPGLGSYILLGELLLEAEARLPPPPPPRTRCGGCRACLDACPTGAFPDAFVLDARRCISYLTIEHRGPIPHELRPALGSRIFGCDVCQQVCPYNAAAPYRNAPAPELAPAEGRAEADLLELLALSGNQFKRWVRGTALERARRPQLLRNVCVALGNAGDRRAIPALARALADRSALVRGHAAWALGQLGEAAACEAALATETDPWVREELELVRDRAS
jgi:epoxyqueuosine reductase